MHASDQVLQAFVAVLQNIPGLEDHVVTDEEKIPKEINLPWAWVNLGDEEIPNQTLSGKKTRAQSIVVTLISSSRFKYMQAANEIAGRIEDLIDADPTLNKVVGTSLLQGISRARDDELHIANVRMNYLVTYWTRAGASSTPV